MIRFSTFLQDNEKKKKKADNKIKEEKEQIDLKRSEIARKKGKLLIFMIYRVPSNTGGEVKAYRVQSVGYEEIRTIP
jgi:hypothetical protein